MLCPDCLVSNVVTLVKVDGFVQNPDTSYETQHEYTAYDSRRFSFTIKSKKKKRNKI